MTTLFRIPNADFSARGKKFKFDPVVPDAGGMVLIEPAHPANPWDEGVPAHQAAVPNLLAEQAAGVTGLSDDHSLAVSRAGGTGALGLFERTPKGGLHVICSQDPAVIPTGTSGTNYFGIADENNWFRDWMVANDREAYKNAALYISQWLLVTRAGKSGGAATATFQITSNSSPTGNYRHFLSSTGNLPGTAPGSAGSEALGVTADHHGSTGVKHKVQASRGYRAEITGATSLNRQFFICGNFGTINNYQTAAHSNPSVVLYRTYVENLDVSGRTYGEVLALDQAAFNAAFAPGGRYHGDTFTDPSTIP